MKNITVESINHKALDDQSSKTSWAQVEKSVWDSINADADASFIKAVLEIVDRSVRNDRSSAQSAVFIAMYGTGPFGTGASHEDNCKSFFQGSPTAPTAPTAKA